MFSAILAVALIGGGDAVGFGKHGGCCGGGCYGGCMGCYGGCTGGKHHGHRGGCCGGCYGGCMGCYGGCMGSCTGGKHHRQRGGCCGGCYGGCYGGCMGSYGCFGGCMGGFGGCMGGFGGCMGGFGGGFGGCIGGGYGLGGVGAGLGGIGAGVGGTVLSSTTPAQGQAASATIVVNVPADAKVTVDGAPTTSTSARRVYISPSLEAGEEFHYTLQAEFNQDGKTINVKKVVAVRAGQETEVNLDATDASSLASR